MKLAVISDLHLGGDNFKLSPVKLNSFLDVLERAHDRIILLGDIFETAFPAWPWQSARDYLRLFRRYRLLTARFHRYPYSLLSGNHDAVALRHFGVPHSIEIECDGARILCTHGHEFEFLYRNAFTFRMTDVYLWLAGVLKRMGIRLLYDMAYDFDHRVNMRDGGLALLKAAQRLATERRLDCVVMGHTHLERLERLPNGAMYINTGDCQQRCVYASIDTRLRTYELKHFQESPQQVLK